MFSVEQKSRNVGLISIYYDKTFSQEFLLTGDRHWDNPSSDQKLQIKHLEQAKKKEAGVIDVGDLFCAMQGKWDKRASKAALRKEHKVEDYLDALVDTAADFFEPYAQQFVMIGMGNHETKVLSKHEVNLTNALVKELNHRAGSKIYNGGYSGWLAFDFIDSETSKRTRKILWYIHGYGGGGPVTRGVIQSNRKAVYLPDPDIILSGHTHDEYVVPIARVRLTDDLRIKYEEQMHIQVPTYKDEYGDGWGGWHIETGKPPKPIGALWLKFVKKKRNGPVELQITQAR